MTTEQIDRVSAKVRSVEAASVATPSRVLHETNRTHVYITQLDGKDVVAKRFKMSDEEALLRYHQEKDMLAFLSDGSDCIVGPVAYVVQPPTYSVVMPLFPKGSLGEVIHSPQAPEVKWPLRLLFMRDVCVAVRHCHSQTVVVRDIKPANYLVDDKMVGRMADMELARTDEQLLKPQVLSYGGPSSRRKTRFEGTPEYMAPELLKAPGSQLQRGVVRGTRSTDVYSVGISLNEIATGQVPYTDVETTTEQLNTVVETRYTPSALMNAIVDEGLRPNMLPDCPEPLRDIIVRCWAADPDSRPPIEEVIAVVDQLLAAEGIAVDAERQQYLGAAKEAPAEAVAPRAQQQQTDDVADWPAVLRLLATSPPDGRFGFLPKLVRGRGEGTAGRRELMEDTWSTVQWHGADGGARCYCCFDGHGGRACAEWLSKCLPTYIQRHILGSPKDISGALRRAFDEAESDWQQEYGAENASGACAVAAVVLGSHLWVAWCGDCRAVVSRDGETFTLTRDHHPSSESERARVTAAGGTVSETRDGKLRVGGRVAVTRSFGDPRRHKGIIATPEVTHIPLRREEVMVLATDGVWDVMTPERVIRNLGETVRHEDYGAKRICSDAYNAGSTDNIGAVVVYLTDEGYVGKPEAAAAHQDPAPAVGTD